MNLTNQIVDYLINILPDGCGITYVYLWGMGEHQRLVGELVMISGLRTTKIINGSLLIANTVMCRKVNKTENETHVPGHLYYYYTNSCGHSVHATVYMSQCTCHSVHVTVLAIVKQLSN